MQTSTNRTHRDSAKAPGPKRRRFTVRAPSAGAVCLAGSFNDWNPTALPMKRSDDGIWCAELPLASGRYEYKFVVDGHWCCDVTDTGPSESVEGCVPNDHGTMNRVIDVAS